MNSLRRVLVNGCHLVVATSILLSTFTVPAAAAPAEVEVIDLAVEPTGEVTVRDMVRFSDTPAYEPDYAAGAFDDGDEPEARSRPQPQDPPDEWQPPGRANRPAAIPGALLPGATKSANLQGGTAESMRVDGVTRLEFPGGALERSVDVTVRRLDSLPAQLPSNVLYAGYGIDVDIREQGNGRRVGRTSRDVTVVIDYSDFPDVGNIASQQLLKIMHFDEDTGEWEILPTVVDTQAKTLTARTDSFSPLVTVHDPTTVIGDYSQPTVPSIDINVDLFTGSASYAYPIGVPAGRAGQGPNLAISYNSGIVDSMRGRDNPQASWVGAGWNLGVGYISRKLQYDVNGVPEIVDDFTLVLNGVSTELIPIGNGQYATENEVFWRIETKTTHMNRDGKYWLVTTRDGTVYRFGYSDETYNGPEGSSLSAWWMVATEEGSGPPSQDTLKTVNHRWNLDLTTDTSGNWVRYDYVAEHNNFAFQWPPQREEEDIGGVMRWAANLYLYGGQNPCPGYQCDFLWEEGQNLFVDHVTYVSGVAPVRGGHLSEITYTGPDPAYKITFEVDEGSREDYPDVFESE
ncbi:MAG: hypothetical protein E3J64_07920, partial [Anaerolineales bacterium]